MRAPTFGEFLPALCHDGRGLTIEAGVKSVFLRLGKANLERLSRIATLGESEAGGVTEEFGSLSQCPEGKPVELPILGERENNPFRMGARLHRRIPCGWGRWIRATMISASEG
jgi:hypothetical protein